MIRVVKHAALDSGRMKGLGCCFLLASLFVWPRWSAGFRYHGQAGNFCAAGRRDEVARNVMMEVRLLGCLLRSAWRAAGAGGVLLQALFRILWRTLLCLGCPRCGRRALLAMVTGALQRVQSAVCSRVGGRGCRLPVARGGGLRGYCSRGVIAMRVSAR